MSLSTLLNPRLCELGKIKVGGKEALERKVAGTNRTWRAPEKHDHFTVTTLHRNAKGDLIEDASLMEELAKEYADQDGKLRQLPIRVLSNDPEDLMQVAWVWYAGKRVAGRSDGKTVKWYGDPKTMKFLGEMREEPWAPEMAELEDPKGNRLFKLHTVFNCVIASKDSRWGGVYKFRTTSRISADQLYGSLIHLLQLTGGVLIGLPLRLVVRPIQVAPKGTTTTVYVVHVELRGPDLQAIQQQALEMARFQLENRSKLMVTQTAYRKLLTGPGEGETEVEAGDIEAEFHPSEALPPEAPTTADPLLGSDGPSEPSDATETSQPQPEASQEPVTDADIDELFEAQGQGGNAPSHGGAPGSIPGPLGR